MHETVTERVFRENPERSVASFVYVGCFLQKWRALIEGPENSRIRVENHWQTHQKEQ